MFEWLFWLGHIHRSSIVSILARAKLLPTPISSILFQSRPQPNSQNRYVLRGEQPQFPQAKCLLFLSTSSTPSTSSALSWANNSRILPTAILKSASGSSVAPLGHFKAVYSIASSTFSRNALGDGVISRFKRTGWAWMLMADATAFWLSV